MEMLKSLKVLVVLNFFSICFAKRVFQGYETINATNLNCVLMATHKEHFGQDQKGG